MGEIHKFVTAITVWLQRRISTEKPLKHNQPALLQLHHRYYFHHLHVLAGMSYITTLKSRKLKGTASRMTHTSEEGSTSSSTWHSTALVSRTVVHVCAGAEELNLKFQIRLFFPVFALEMCLTKCFRRAAVASVAKLFTNLLT